MDKTDNGQCFFVCQHNYTAMQGYGLCTIVNNQPSRVGTVSGIDHRIVYVVIGADYLSLLLA